MKYIFVYLLLMATCCSAVAQNNFTGIAKYKITVEGNNRPVTDSMSVIFNKQKVKIILYLPDSKRPGHAEEKIFIDDFTTQKSISVNSEDKTFRTGSLNTSGKYNFYNTGRIAITNDILLCFQYKSDSAKLDKSKVLGVECLGSIDFKNPSVKNYFFLGIQPIIIDNRIVTDFIVMQPGAVKQRTYISEIKEMDNVESYFNLAGYKQAN